MSCKALSAIRFPISAVSTAQKALARSLSSAIVDIAPMSHFSNQNRMSKQCPKYCA
jgi:hypothetical protein